MSFEAVSGYQCLNCGEFFGGDENVPVTCEVCQGCENCCDCEEPPEKKAEQIKRCRDCEYWSEYKDEDDEVSRWCSMIGNYTTPEWYCADFKKK